MNELLVLPSGRRGIDTLRASVIAGSMCVFVGSAPITKVIASKIIGIGTIALIATTGGLLLKVRICLKLKIVCRHTLWYIPLQKVWNLLVRLHQGASEHRRNRFVAVRVK